MKTLPPIAALLLAATFVTSHTSAQTLAEAATGSPKGPFDLAIRAQARAILVEVRETANGSATMKHGPSEIKRTIAQEVTSRWVDEVGASGGAAVHHRRTFLEVRKSDEGRVADPGLEGVCVEITRVEDDVRAKARAPRHVQKAFLKRQSSLEGALGLWLELPARAMVGDVVKIEAETLIATMMNIEDELDAFAAEVRFDGVADHQAMLSGTASFSCSFETNGIATTSHYEGKLAIAVDLRTHLIAKTTFSGTSTVKGRGAQANAIEGAVEFETTASATEVDASAARVKKPAFRDNVHEMGGVTFSLPSFWMRVPGSKQGVKIFNDSRTSDGAHCEVRIADDKVSPTDERFIEGFLKAARREAPDFKLAKATFPIGDGLTFECTANDGDKVRGFVAPCENGLVRVRVVGSANAIKKVEADLKLMQSSLADV